MDWSLVAEGVRPPLDQPPTAWNDTVDFMDVAVHVQASGFLDACTIHTLNVAHHHLAPNSMVLNTWIAPPCNPVKKRLYGFGRVLKDRSLNQDVVNPLSMIHFAWPYLSAEDRLAAIQASFVWKQYAELRHFACVTSLKSLQLPRLLVADWIHIEHG
ncbi:unnamed protein product [Cylindrotheca closterium]|uniref:Uncharacterized protein n=1 Tax=Cylindrotheca closterium TaxID=2856 RepID=A0AAD2GDM5_9STRA|nr:unnamed protein product [Cylindrotheca closterium]